MCCREAGRRIYFLPSGHNADRSIRCGHTPQKLMVQCRGGHPQPRNASLTDVPTVPGPPAAGPSYEAPRSRAARGIKRGVLLMTASAAETGTAARPVALFVM